jgi:hypothetical protein
MEKLTILSLILSLVVFSASCSNSDINYNYPENPNTARKQRAGKFFDEIKLFNNHNKQTFIDSNQDNNSNPLWIASVEVIGKLMPIAVIDSNSGLIITKWSLDDKNKNQRIKINLLIKGGQIKENNIILSIFKQQKDKKGNWIAQRAESKNLSSKLIKEKILKKAEEISAGKTKF